MFKNLVLITFIAALSMGSVLAMPLSELMVKDSINNVLVRNIADLQPAMVEPEPVIAELPDEPEYYPTPTTLGIVDTEEIEEEETEDEAQEEKDAEELLDTEDVDDENGAEEEIAEDIQVADESEEVVDEEYDDTQFEFPTNRTDPGAFENF